MNERMEIGRGDCEYASETYFRSRWRSEPTGDRVSSGYTRSLMNENHWN